MASEKTLRAGWGQLLEAYHGREDDSETHASISAIGDKTELAGSVSTATKDRGMSWNGVPHPPCPGAGLTAGAQGQAELAMASRSCPSSTLSFALRASESWNSW